MAQYAAAIDQGTTSSPAMVFKHDRPVAAVSQKEAKEIWARSQEVLDEALEQVGASRDDIAGLGITNQRETTVVWDRNTGEPVMNAIVWQDTRTDKLVDELSRDGGQNRFAEQVGLPLATYFSGPKVRWILDNVEGAREKADAGDLIFGNIDTWCIWNLTGGTDGGLHITDPTNASRTMLMDLRKLAWDDGIAGTIGLLTTVGYKIGDNDAIYCLEGAIAITGALVQWLRDNLKMIKAAPEVEDLARSVDDNGGCYIVPAFSGLFAPYWKSNARGVVAGLTRYVSAGHIARATLEATAYQSREVVEAMNNDSGVDLESLKVDGGMVANDLLMQFQADLLGVPVIRPQVAETTSLGAAYAAGLATGFWGEVEDLRENWQEDKRWEPQMESGQRDEYYKYWKRAVTKSFDWFEADEN